MNIGTVIQTIAGLVDDVQTLNFLLGEASSILSKLHNENRDLTEDEIAIITGIRLKSENALKADI
jgi:hypothetical protein